MKEKLTIEQKSVIVDVVEEYGAAELALALTQMSINSDTVRIEHSKRKAIYDLIHALKLAEEAAPISVPEKV